MTGIRLMAARGAPNDAVYRTGTTSLTWFEIPFGVLVPNRVEGMTIGGRALSATHDADMWSPRSILLPCHGAGRWRRSRAGG